MLALPGDRPPGAPALPGAGRPRTAAALLDVAALPAAAHGTGPPRPVPQDERLRGRPLGRTVPAHPNPGAPGHTAPAQSTADTTALGTGPSPPTPVTHTTPSPHNLQPPTS